MTQQKAAMVEETTAAAHSLAQETTGLFELVEQFHLGDPRVSDAAGLGAHNKKVTRLANARADILRKSA